MNSTLIVLILGFIAVLLISLILARRVNKHAGGRYGALVHLLVAVVGVYYWADVMMHRRSLFTDPYFFFWLFIIISQTVLYLTKRRIRSESYTATSILFAKRRKVPNNRGK